LAAKRHLFSANPREIMARRFHTRRVCFVSYHRNPMDELTSTGLRNRTGGKTCPVSVEEL